MDIFSPKPHLHQKFSTRSSYARCPQYDEAEVDDSDTELHQHTSSAADSEHSSAISDSTIDELQTLCDALLNDSASVDEVLACETLKTVHDSIQQFKDHLTTCF